MIQTGHQGYEIASEWIFSNFDNPIFDTPIPKVKKQAAAATAVAGFNYSEEGLMMIMSMGLTDKQAKRGLRKCNNDVERAMDFIFSHMDDPDSEDEQMDVDQGHGSESPTRFETPRVPKTAQCLNRLVHV